MKFLPLLLPVLACSPTVTGEATCETSCGMFFVGSFGTKNAGYPIDAPTWSCEAFEAVERGVRLHFPEANDTRFRTTCDAIAGWTVRMVDAPQFEDPLLGTLIGLTDCSLRTTTIANLPPDRSALPHELAHVVQGCLSNTCAHPGVDAQHYCWQENDIYSVAAKANLEAGRLLGESR